MDAFEDRRQRVVARIEEARFAEDIAPHVVDALRPVLGIGFRPGEVPLGGSKVGGRPHVPTDFNWPGDLAFLAQLNFAECKPYDVAGVLPSTGILYLFSTCDDSEVDEGDEGAYAVHYLPGRVSDLTVADFPAEVHRTEGRFVERRIVFSESYLLAADDDLDTRLFYERDAEILDEIFASAGCHTGVPPAARMLGQPYFFRPELAEAFEPAQDTLLLALPGNRLWRGTDDQASIYGDGGFFVIIRTEALQKMELGEAWVLFESGT